MAVKRTHLAKELEKYYYREGNRIIFPNKLTLNQLALKMWERLGYREIDASVLSRVLTGERLLSDRQLSVFCNLLKIDTTRKKLLNEALVLDYSERYHFNPVFTIDYLDGFINGLLEQAHNLNMSGKSELASDLVNILSEQITLLLLMKNSDIIKNQLLLLRATILVRKLWIESTQVLPSRALLIFRPIIHQLFLIAKTTKNKELYSESLYHWGNSLYMSSHFLAAQNYLNVSLKLSSKKSTYIKDALRTKILVSSYLKEKESYHSTEKQISRMLQENDLKLIEKISLMEGYYRAGSLMKVNSSLDGLEESRRLHYKLEDRKLWVFTYVQLVRSMLEAANNLATRDGHIIQVAKNGYKKALESKYLRHAIKIKKLLVTSL